MGTSGIILAGGHSSRMKTNKALMEFNQQTMISNVISAMTKEVDEIIIVTNDPTEYLDFDAMLVTDLYPRLGPSSGIHAGLKASSNEYGFVVACDMPFINSDLIGFMISQAPGYDAVVPWVEGYYQPLHAIYHKKAIPFIEKCLQEKRYKVTAFYDFICIKKIVEKEIAQFADINKVFFNVNSSDDLKKAKEMVGDKHGQ